MTRARAGEMMSPWTKLSGRAESRAAWRRYGQPGEVIAVVVRHHTGAVHAMTGKDATFVETAHATVEEAQAAADERLRGATSR